MFRQVLDALRTHRYLDEPHDPTLTPDCTVPAKGPVGVDDTQRVEGRVHHLPGTEQVHHHGNAQVANQNAQRNVHHPTYQHTCVTYSKRKSGTAHYQSYIRFHYLLHTLHCFEPNCMELQSNPVWPKGAATAFVYLLNFVDVYRNNASHVHISK